jgi:DNA-directed RNA polymerase specialized sigma24 family protein
LPQLLVSVVCLLRHRGCLSDEAKDLTQEIFLRLIEKRSLCLAVSTRGKFRSFLLTSRKYFLINEWNKARAAKRCGAQAFLPVAWEVNVKCNQVAMTKAVTVLNVNGPAATRIDGY